MSLFSPRKLFTPRIGATAFTLLSLLFCLMIPFNPRGMPVALLIIWVMLLWFADKKNLHFTRTEQKAGLSILIFLLYCAISYFWSSNPAQSLKGITTFAPVMIVGYSAMVLLIKYPKDILAKIAAKLFPFLLFGVLLSWCLSVLIYQISQGNIALPFNFLGGIDFNNNLSRHIAKSCSIAVIIFFSIALWIKNLYSTKPISVFMITFPFTLLIFGDSQSAALGGLAGGVILLAQKFPYRFTARLVQTGFIISFFAFVFIANSLSAKDFLSLYIFDGLQQRVSFDIRLETYHFFAKEFFNAPLWGHGFFVSKQYIPAAHSLETAIPANLLTPHNFHLQILNDLGIIGCGLLFIAFFYMGSVIAKHTAEDFRLYGLSIFASAIGIALFNFVIWQFWIVSAFWLALLCFLIACAAQTHKQNQAVSLQ